MTRIYSEFIGPILVAIDRTNGDPILKFWDTKENVGVEIPFKSEDAALRIAKAMKREASE